MIIKLLESGGGFSRPAGDPDLAYVIYQVYEFMVTHELSFYFNGVYYHFTYWLLFMTSIVFWLICDILYIGYRFIDGGYANWGNQI